MEPITRTEQYLSKIAGDDHGIPEAPITRVEQYLDAIARRSTGGASIDDTAGDGDTDKTWSADKITRELEIIESGQSASASVSGTDPVIQASSNTRYICGEITSLDFTPSASGICEVIFTSGTTATVLTLPQTVQMPEWFVVEANHTYEISVIDGVYGAVMVW